MRTDNCRLPRYAAATRDELEACVRALFEVVGSGAVRSRSVIVIRWPRRRVRTRDLESARGDGIGGPGSLSRGLEAKDEDAGEADGEAERTASPPILDLGDVRAQEFHR